MAKRTTGNGTEYETFTSLQDMEVGQIVMIPDGRAAEITRITEGGEVGIRPWDKGGETMTLWADDLQPWEE